MAKCRITVLKCLFDQELKDRYVPDPDYGRCPFFQPGQVYECTDGEEKPEDFRCNVGWRSIQTEVKGFAGPKEEQHFFADRPQVVCCNDGIRPVLFLLERIE